MYPPFCLDLGKAIYVMNRVKQKRLETALLTHGLPATVNLQTVLERERIIRDKGAVPCSVGVLNGKVVIGLNAEELSELAAVERPRKLPDPAPRGGYCNEQNSGY